MTLIPGYVRMMKKSPVRSRLWILRDKIYEYNVTEQLRIKATKAFEGEQPYSKYGLTLYVFAAFACVWEKEYGCFKITGRCEK